MTFVLKLMAFSDSDNNYLRGSFISKLLLTWYLYLTVYTGRFISLLPQRYFYKIAGSFRFAAKFLVQNQMFHG